MSQVLQSLELKREWKGEPFIPLERVWAYVSLAEKFMDKKKKTQSSENILAQEDLSVHEPMERMGVTPDQSFGHKCDFIKFMRGDGRKSGLMKTTVPDRGNNGAEG